MFAPDKAAARRIGFAIVADYLVAALQFPVDRFDQGVQLGFGQFP